MKEIKKNIGWIEEITSDIRTNLEDEKTLEIALHQALRLQDYVNDLVTGLVLEEMKAFRIYRKKEA